ncbi:MAG: helix-turn-helix domain-containing protein [Ruminococcus flavefaciens]|nr:helix-turn-helix domain-containing protein [Ruminococcus flavefaciens]
MAENNEIMKFEEVMEYLNIGKSTLYNLLRNGEIRSFKIGKVWKIPRSAIEEYIKNLLTD